MAAVIELAELNVDAVAVGGSLVACGASRLTGRLWSGAIVIAGANGKVGTASTRAGVCALACVSSPGGTASHVTFASGNDAGTVELWSAVEDGASGAPELRSLSTERAHDGAVTSISSSAAHPNAFVSGGADAHLRFWDASSLKLVSSVEHAHVGAVHATAVHPTDGNLVATAGEDGAVRVWDARAVASSGKPTMQRAGDDIRRNMGRAFAVEWCRGGGSVAVGYESGEVCFLDVEASNGGLDTRGVVKAHGDAVRSLAWDPSSQRLASCGDDGVTAGLHKLNPVGPIA